MTRHLTITVHNYHVGSCLEVKNKSVAKHRETQLAEAAPECVHLLAAATQREEWVGLNALHGNR